MIHVAFIVSRLSKGGPINQLYYLCKYLDFSKIRFTIVTTSPRTTPNTYHDELRAMGIDIVELNHGKLSSVLKAGKTIQQLIGDRRIDIVQSFGFRSEFIASRLKGVVRLTTIRNRPLFNYRIIYGYLTGSVLCFLHMRFVKQFDHVVACSKTVAANIAPFGIHADVITNALDFSIIPDPVRQATKMRLREKLGLPPRKKIFITVSSNLPGKNIPFLIDVFLGAKEMGDHILVIAGYVREPIVEKHKHAANVLFTGRVSNLYEYFKASDAFISASLSEGMPNAPLEALAVGLPVILSDIDAHKEIVDSVDYSIGAIFENNNQQDFLEKLNAITRRDDERLSMNCIACIQEQFSAEQMSQHYQSLYHLLALNNGLN
jgi:glycosyltransferase involved in cell wall biosynthesis